MPIQLTMNKKDIPAHLLKFFKPTPPIKRKDDMLIPARFALAAQADGWYLRSDVIWHKRNPMPESVTDRPTKAHEYIYLLTKSEKYYYDAEAVKEAAVVGYNGSSFTNGKTAAARVHLAAIGQKERANQDGESGRNKRSVWTIASQPYGGAHFATYPMEIPLTCIKAGSSEYGVCSACGAPWERLVQKSGGTIGKGSWVDHANDSTQGKNRRTGSKADEDFSTYKVEHLGWQPTCACNAGEPIPATVCDPFNGSGTTGRAALQLGRSYLGIDISKEYLTDLAPERLSNVQMEMCIV